MVYLSYLLILIDLSILIFIYSNQFIVFKFVLYFYIYDDLHILNSYKLKVEIINYNNDFSKLQLVDSYTFFKLTIICRDHYKDNHKNI
jgi:hypothetical protein